MLIPQEWPAGTYLVDQPEGVDVTADICQTVSCHAPGSH